MKSGSKAFAENEEIKFPFNSFDLPVGELFIDESYQRPLGNRHKVIVNAFNLHRFESLTVNERRPGHFAVVDGQARHAAARELNIREVPCRIYSGLSVEKEAELFVWLQTGRRNLTAYDRFKGLLCARDAAATEVQSVCTGVSMQIRATSGPCTIGAVAALMKIHTTHGPHVLRRALLVSQKVWGSENQQAFSSGILRGLASVLARFEHDRRIIDGLRRRQLLPHNLAAKAANFMHGPPKAGKMLSTNPTYIGRAIIDVCHIQDSELSGPLDRPVVRRATEGPRVVTNLGVTMAQAQKMVDSRSQLRD